MTRHKDILVVGGGSWGTAFANYLCRHHPQVNIWVREREVSDQIRNQRENRLFLPGIQLEANLTPQDSLDEAASARVLVLAVPSKFIRQILLDMKGAIGHRQTVVNLSKGFEAKSLMTISQIAAQCLGEGILRQWVTISGPSFARELALGHPTAVVAASQNQKIAEAVQNDFSSATLRIYRTDDLPGIEVGGAVKNIMAIASGMVSQLGLGFNTTASLVTRASMEISRLGLRMGARSETFWGLAGIGDLMLTCFGELSRNFQLGRQIAQGKTLTEIEGSTPMVAEGVETTRAVQEMAVRYGIDMPICREVYCVLFEGKNPRQAISDLMKRSLKTEWNIN